MQMDVPTVNSRGFEPSSSIARRAHLVSEHGHVDARVALATDPQVMGAVVGEHAEPVAQERVVVLSFVTTSTATKHQSVVFNNK
jgi:hypothetical protein